MNKEKKKPYRHYPMYIKTADKIGQIRKLRGYSNFMDTVDDLICNQVKITIQYANITKNEEVKGADKAIEIVKGALNE